MMHNFWNKRGIINYLLLPFSGIYYVITKTLAYFQKPKSVDAHVICVGNIVTGGGGKTPVVQSLASKHRNAAIILRGYKGDLSSTTPLKVDPNKHTAFDVGDEALLHAKIAPTYICVNRYNAAELAVNEGAKTIIMDDGLQNHSLKKDETYIIFDNEYFIGNGLLLPAGPLRNTLKDVLGSVDKIFMIDYGKRTAKHTLPINPVYLEAKLTNSNEFKNSDAIIFCGIANPNKFIRSLQAHNVNIKHQFIFPDHHHFSESELLKAIELSNKLECKILTTSKDHIKIPMHLQNHFTEAKLGIALP